MKIYKTTRERKLIIIFFGVLPLLAGGFYLFDTVSVYSKFVIILFIIFILVGVSTFFIGRCIIDEEKMVLNFVSLIPKDTIYWKNIDRMDSFSFLAPFWWFTPLYIYSSIPRTRPILIDVRSFPMALLNDILQNTPSTATVKLDSSIKERYIEVYGAKVFEKFEKSGDITD